MSLIGTIPVSVHTVDRDEVVYGRAGNTVSHTDVVALRRTPPKSSSQPLRTNVRFERGFDIASTPGQEKPVTVSITATVPPGVTPAQVQLYVTEACQEAATLVASLSTTGDIHL